ncbi:hypothetical protein [Streptomyces canus]|uniref:hypothetical protein n=1 Tax=Streptomyces canus TaxID=58343 RepID=UPI003714E628
MPEIPVTTAPDRGHHPTIACQRFAYSTGSVDVTSRAVTSRSRIWADLVEAGEQSDPALEVARPEILHVPDLAARVEGR